jgi:hypothetical protein
LQSAGFGFGTAGFGFGSAVPTFSEFFGNSDKGQMLENLQKVYGKEAGTEVFDIAVKIAENSEILVELTPKERAAVLKLQEAISHGVALKTENGSEIIPLDMSEEDFTNMRILAVELGVKPEDIPQFEALISNLLKSELITSEDLADAVKVPTHEFSDGSLGIFQEDLDAAKSEESSPARNTLEELWSMMKGEPEVKEEELPQNFERPAHLHTHLHSHRIAHEHGYIRPPKVNIEGVEITLQPVKILNHGFGEGHIHSVRGAIKVPSIEQSQNVEQNQNDLPKALFGLEMDFETGEFSIWENNKETGKPELIMKGAFNLKEGKLDVNFATKETAPIVGSLAAILKVLYEKYMKLAKKEGEEEEEELEAPEAVVMKDKIAANNALRAALIDGDQAAIEEALFRGANLSEVIDYEPILQNTLSQRAFLLNFFSEHPSLHAKDQIAISQELENDDLLGSFFLLLKKVNNNGMLTKEEKAEINAYLENRITPENGRGAMLTPNQEPIAKEKPVVKEKFVAREKPEPTGRGVRLTPTSTPNPTPTPTPTSTPTPQPVVAQAQPQPEVRAVWEGADLKIEAFDPKTGEKLQTVSSRMPHSMQDRIHEFEVVKQVIAQAKLITTPTGDQRMTLQLRPEQLGQVDMRITLSHNEMQIQARVESPVAQAALETHIGLLREGLEKQGITLDRLEVSVEQKDKQDAFSLAERQDREEQRQHQRRSRRGREQHLAVSIAAKDANGDTGRRLGYNSMEYLA